MARGFLNPPGHLYPFSYLLVGLYYWNMAGKEIYPEGVDLYDFDDNSYRRQALLDGVLEEMQNSFPRSYGGITMEVDDLRYEGPEDYDLPAQKKALLEDKYLYRKLRGNVTLKDEATGEVLDNKRVSLMKVPYLTERGTFIHGGNEYTTINQQRLLPGAYTRRQNNGQLETQFNVKPGSGRDFRVGFEPETGQYRLRLGQSNLHLYSLLRDIGMDDESLEKSWGKDVLESNRNKYDRRVLDKAYNRLIAPFNQNSNATNEEKIEAIKDALNGYKIHSRVAQKNLPNLFERTKSAEWNARQSGKEIVNKEPKRFAPDLDVEETWKAAHVFDTLDIIERGIYSDFVQLTGDEWEEQSYDLEKKSYAIQQDQPIANTDHADFNPDVEPEELTEAANSLYAGVGPRLASMETWPSHWFHEQDPHGWIQWYQRYNDGRRTADDDRQIKRWKSFKARMGAQFKKAPTPKRYWALRNWAIDPLLLLDDKEERERVKEEAENYKEQQWKKWRKKHAFFKKQASTKELLMAIIQLLNRELAAGLPIEGTYAMLEQALREYLMEEGNVDIGMMSMAQNSAQDAASEIQKLMKPAAVKESAEMDRSELDMLQDAKNFSDNKQYGAKVKILVDMMRANPEDWVIDSPGGKYPGVTHVPTGFRLHMPQSHIPASVGEMSHKNDDVSHKPEKVIL